MSKKTNSLLHHFGYKTSENFMSCHPPMCQSLHLYYSYTSTTQWHTHTHFFDVCTYSNMCTRDLCVLVLFCTTRTVKFFLYTTLIELMCSTWTVSSKLILVMFVLGASIDLIMCSPIRLRRPQSGSLGLSKSQNQFSRCWHVNSICLILGLNYLLWWLWLMFVRWRDHSEFKLISRHKEHFSEIMALDHSSVGYLSVYMSPLAEGGRGGESGRHHSPLSSDCQG